MRGARDFPASPTRKFFEVGEGGDFFVFYMAIFMYANVLSFYIKILLLKIIICIFVPAS